MNYFEMNMECIKKHKRYMYNLIKDLDISITSNRVEEVKSVITKDKNNALIIKYQSKEYRLNSIYRPVEEARKWVNQYKFQNLENLISMYGFGNGTFARAVLEKLGDGDIFLIYEPSADIFWHVINNYDITDILAHPRITIAVEKVNEFEFHNEIRRFMSIKNIRDQIICVYSQYDKIFPESCIMFWKELKDTYYSTKANINTEIFFGKRFIDNTLSNMKYLHNSYTLLELKEILPKDVPAMIIAAGPSVAKQINVIRNAKGHAVIIAVDRILEFLLDSGVIPDYVVTLDPIKPVKYFSERTDIKIPLICFQEANSEILDRHKGIKIICNCSSYLEKIYLNLKKKPPRTISGTSVATLAFSICVELEYKNIILVGQDLAYDGERSHTGDAEERYGTNKDLMVEDINGNLIRSRFDWKEFIVWYQDFLTINPDLNVIDAKDKGAKIKGTTVMSLQEALDKYCINEFDYNTYLQTNIRTFDSQDMLRIKSYLENGLVCLNKIKRKAKEAIKYCNALMEEKRRFNTNEQQDLINKLSKINSFIEKQEIYKLMDRFAIASSAQHIMDLGNFTDDIIENNKKTYEKSKNIYEAIIDASEYVKPRLEEAIKHVIPATEIK